jgi:hypothetical protein
VVSIVGRRFVDGSCASGTVASASFATHCFAPAGLSWSSHSKPNRFWKNPAPHWVGVFVQVTSRPLVIVSAPFPLP